MKRFTKAALILTLALVILGSIFCAISLGIGFTFSEFWDDVEVGKFSVGMLEDIPYIDAENDSAFDWEKSYDWDSADTVDMTYSAAEIKNIETDIGIGALLIQENEDTDKIHVIVEYRKKDHRCNVSVNQKKETLKIEEKDHASWGWINRNRNDDVRITVEVPADMEFKELDFSNSVGVVTTTVPLKAETMSVDVDAGVCDILGKLTISKSVELDIDAGDLNIEEMEAKSVSIDVDAGGFAANLVKAEKLEADCDVGDLRLTMDGSEQDYNYIISCDMGNVDVGNNSYSGLGSKRTITNSGNRRIEIDCDLGNITVNFTE